MHGWRYRPATPGHAFQALNAKLADAVMLDAGWGRGGTALVMAGCLQAAAAAYMHSITG